MTPLPVFLLSFGGGPLPGTSVAFLCGAFVKVAKLVQKYCLKNEIGVIFANSQVNPVEISGHSDGIPMGFGFPRQVNPSYNNHRLPE